MRCKECGIEVDNFEVFCPNCGAPLRMTADYDFIQAEIGGKVDQFLNDKNQKKAEPQVILRDQKPKDADKTIIINKKETRNSRTIPELTIIGEKPRYESENGDTINITKAIYGQDSVFAVDGSELGDYDDEPEDEEYDKVYEEDPDEAYEDEMLTEESSETVNDSPTGKPRNTDSQKDLARIKARARARKRKKRKKIIIFSVIAAVVIALAILIVVLTTGGKKQNPDDNASADRITSNIEEGGIYSVPFEVTISSENGLRIYYTTDGSEPNINSIPYGTPLKFTNADINGDSQEITLKVVSYKREAAIVGSKATFHFTVVKSQLEAPYMEPEPGDYYEEEYIYIYGPDGAEIYYTYDGTTPTKSSTLYTGPIMMKRGNNILNAIAIDSSGVQSEVSSYVYNLIIEAQISYEYAYECVVQDLLDSGLIEDEKADDNGAFKVPGGGTRRIINAGTTLIDNDSYIVIQVDYTNDGSSVQATTYYGIDDQTGEVVRLNKSGMSYTLG